MSNSRLEKFIYAICSMEVSDLPAPLSRIEILWNCLITGETPDFEPQSRNEQYLMAMLGLYELENLPTPMSRGEKLLYKIAMGETDLSDIPAYLSRYEELLGYLAENGGVGDFEYILQTLNQRLSTLYSTKERPMKQAVIKGDTLVNELPRPSLKNTMTNAASQKLNQGCDNGKTLVNIKGEETTEIPMAAYPKNDFLIPLVKKNTDYLIKYDVTISNGLLAVGFLKDRGSWSKNLEKQPNVGIIKLNSGEYPNYFRIIGPANEIITINNLMIIEYQDGMENWDIPYFEGTKTFSATLNVVDGEFKQAVVKGQTDYKSVNWMTNFHYQYGLNVSTGKVEYMSRNNRCSTRIEIDENRSFIFKAPSDIYISIVTADINNNNLRDYGWYVTTTDEIRFTVEDNCKFLYLNFKKPNESAFTSESEIINSGLIVKEQKLVSVQLSEVTTTGKNLFDVSKETKNMTIDLDYGHVNLQTNDRNTSDFIKVTPDTNYICNVVMTRLAYYDKDKRFITSSTNVSNHITIPTLGEYIKFSYNNSLSNVQFEQGTIATPYEPYQSNTLTLAEPVTLRKVGDVEDEFDALTGQVTARIREMVFDGSEQWSGSSFVSTNHYCAYTRLSKSKNIMSLDVICDSLPTKDILSSSKDYEGCIINNTKSSDSPGNLVIKIAKSKLSSESSAGIKEYLSQNPITVQYQLATESTKTVNTTITDQDGATQTKLHSFNDGYLSVSSQGLLPSAVNYEVPTNNSYYLPDMLTLGAQYTARGSADCNATIDGKLLALGKNRIFTTPSTLTNRLMVLDAPVDDLMFIKGDQTAKDFGYFEGMKSVEFSGVQVTGKNKFDGVSYIDAFIGPNMNINADRDVVSILLDVEKNTDYILSTKMYFDRGIIGGSSTPIMISGVLNKITSGRIDNTIAFNSGNYTHIMIYLNSTKINLEEIQVEKGSVATPYEPYKSTTLTLNEPVALRKVGVVQDTLDGLTGEATERIGEVVLDGSDDENWTIASEPWTKNGYYTFEHSIQPSGLPIYNDNDIYVICDKFNGISYNVSKTDATGIVLYSAKGQKVGIKQREYTTLDEWKQYLQSNPLTVQYRLGTPTTKTLDLTTIDQDGQPTKLKTFNDISYVEIDADNIIPSVDVEVATKISETLSTLGLDHHDISETQNKLSQTIEEQSENTDATMMATTEIYEQTL